MRHRFVASGRDLPAAPSPISQAVVAGDHCYVSGQPSMDPTGAFRAGTTREEAERAFHNQFAALDAAGFARDDPDTRATALCPRNQRAGRIRRR